MTEKQTCGFVSSVEKFTVRRTDYYSRAFAAIEKTRGIPRTWNTMAALFGPFWAAARGCWGFFWMFMVLELFALVQICRGLFADLGADSIARYEKLMANIAHRQEQAAMMLAAGDEQGAETARKVAENLSRVAAETLESAKLAAGEATWLLSMGLVLMLTIKLVEGVYANITYEKQYLRWRVNPSIQAGLKLSSTIYGILVAIAIWPLTLLRFTSSYPDAIVHKLTGGILGEKFSITRFPVEKELFSAVAVSGDAWFDWLANHFGHVFHGVTTIIRSIINGLEVILIETPWPVVMVVIIAIAFRLAGVRVAIFTAASLAYLAFMGLWEISMITVALIGAGAAISIIFGIPLGIWCGKSRRAYTAAEPVLDLMQTMPAFVYLIPIIAFFGTGKPPGVLATVIFAMPPVVRLTALGVRGVPEDTKEAAIAFGCSSWGLLRNVEMPLAMPSIMTGINQTVLMSLSMVVIASLIGAEGLGALILQALQYAAKGQGLLAGLAILLCAMVIDRIAQGAYRKRKKL